MKFKIVMLCIVLNIKLSYSQNISDFLSVEPLDPTTDFIIPSSHTFQKIIERSDPLTQGGLLPEKCDFTGYVPINGSSENGYLSINHEKSVGAVTVLDINFDSNSKLWESTFSQAIDFSDVAGTSKNCSGTVTAWNTVISCEEIINTDDTNNDGYRGHGWCVEIDPATKTIIDKRWALGNFQHENIVVHQNNRTVYQGVDTPNGYLYKFVADVAEDLSSGALFVYSGSKNGPGVWIPINNVTSEERNTTLEQSAQVGGTIFNGVEDVEIGLDGMVYFAVKNEDRVYRFGDSDPLTGTTVINMETFVGNTAYQITHNNGTSTVEWGTGNDNLAFDGQGNLWVLQDGDNNYIWVVENGHTQAQPKVKLFGRSPIGGEPTGITFSPDFRFLFMSMMKPDVGNAATLQEDAAGNQVGFEKDVVMAIALKTNLGDTSLSISLANTSPKYIMSSNPIDDNLIITFNDILNVVNINVTNALGQSVLSKKINSTNQVVIDLSTKSQGIYFVTMSYEDHSIDQLKVIKKN